MSSNAPRRLLFFPTPYSDEILYSVLCRYHSRCGNPSAPQTNLELWGKRYGKSVFLPDGIEHITSKMPESANLTTERFIFENTIFPWLKPFVSRERGGLLIDALTHENPKIYNLTGLARTHSLSLPYLRYCPRCSEDDMKKYAETYWHRVHQLPDIGVCPHHHIALIDSQYHTSALKHGFFSALSAVPNDKQPFFADVSDKYSGIADDAAWILQNGVNLGGLERTKELYDGWLRSKCYRLWNGTTRLKNLGSDIAAYYGREVLEPLGAYNSGICVWLKPLLRTKEINCRPVLHLLLMRFLAGSAEAFFAGTYEPHEKYQPYGAPPYPCRNVVCEHYLRDVIDSIEINNVKGNYRATFSCPHCGFTYRRKNPLPKEAQYSGQIDVCDYGELWHETLKDMLLEQTPIRRIGMALKCDTRTVVKLGIELGFFPPEQRPKLRPYLVRPKAEVSFDEQREHYRKRWMDAIAATPAVTRKELRAMDSKADQWLHMHDADWIGENSPPSECKLPKWAHNDDEYAERIKNAANQIRGSPGKPKLISVPTLAKYSDIPKLYRILASGRLPKTQAAVEAFAETLEQWQHRKIRWAVQQMRENGEVITVYKVRHRATIEDPERKLDEFIADCIMNSE
jgi:hypothetical protein